MKPRNKAAKPFFQLLKCPTGITGLDEITMGGLPRGCPTLVAGGPGSGKTLLALEFLVKGASSYDEPGVLMASEERILMGLDLITKEADSGIPTRRKLKGSKRE